MQSEANILNQIKQNIETLLPSKDGRSNISPLAFVVNLIFCYSGDTKRSSLEAIRREMIGRQKIKISRSSFWERLSGKRLQFFLLAVVSSLMSQLSGGMLVGFEILSSLGVSGIFWSIPARSHFGTALKRITLEHLLKPGLNGMPVLTYSLEK